VPLNPHVKERMAACLKQLLAAYEGGASMSAATKGTERELFVEVFLKNVLAPAYRFGTGDIVDSHDHRTGQVDLVIEHSTAPSFPLVGATIPRLYLAEGVALAIEVKSDLAKQWDEVVSTSQSVAKLQPKGRPHVPFFVVGFRGWKSRDTILEHASDANKNGAKITGVVCLDPANYVGAWGQWEPQPPQPHPEFPNVPVPQMPKPVFKTLLGENESALFCLLAQIHEYTSQLTYAPSQLFDYITMVPVKDE
jgi:hypothetical protein